ncbi:Protein AF-9 like protein [Dictyocoela muelleri]|nr:Protein AF-9 like protein [Dictyocoela muelleri]
MKRTDNVNIVKGISIISITEPIKNPVNACTHKWKIFIKGFGNDTLNYIKTVTYTLHETFDNPVRVTTHPFMIEEYGWGEFKVLVKIKFIDKNEKSIIIKHLLKLHDKECINETYEEIVFRSPTVVLFEALGNTSVREENEDYHDESEKIEKAIDYVLEEYDNNYGYDT